MGSKNRHGIRNKAKGGGKKWRPSPNDPVLEERKKNDRIDWKPSIGDLFKKEKR